MRVRQCFVNLAPSHTLTLATIVKRSVKNELNPCLYPPRRRAAGERAQVLVTERGGNVAVF